MGVSHQPDRYAVALSLSVACIFIIFFIFLTWYFLYFPLFSLFLAIEADEVSDEEEAHINDVINYLIHAYTDLVTPPNFTNVALALILITRSSLLPFAFLYFLSPFLSY